MQESIYDRLLVVQGRQKKVIEKRQVFKPVEGGTLEPNGFVNEEVLVNDRNEVHVRVFPHEFGYLLRLDQSGVGEGVQLLGFTRDRFEALEFATRLTLLEALNLAAVQALLAKHITAIASSPIIRQHVPISEDLNEQISAISEPTPAAGTAPDSTC